MVNVSVEVQADNGACAKVTSDRDAKRVVLIDIDPELKWDGEGLLKLAATLSGVAQMLPQT